MSTTKNTSRIEKIRNLLDLAESSNEHEAELAREQAERLMVRWGIDEALAASQDGTLKEEITVSNLEMKGSYAIAHMTLGNAIAKALGGVQALQVKHGKTKYLQLVGYKSDLERVEWMLARLQLQANVALNRWWATVKDEGTYTFATANDKFKVRRSYLLAFASGVHQRMLEERKVAESEYEPQALVLLNDRSRDVDDFISEKYGRLRKGRSLKNDGRAYRAGYEAGQKADVGTTAVSA